MLPAMARDPDDKPDDPTDQLKQGLGLLFRAARGMARDAKKEIERTNFGRAVEDAGRELVRATANVMNRIAHEVDNRAHGGEAPPPEGYADAPPDGGAPPENRGAPVDEDDEFDGVRPKKPTGPTPEDPGFRIADDDDPKKTK